MIITKISENEFDFDVLSVSSKNLEIFLKDKIRLKCATINEINIFFMKKLMEEE